MNKYDYEKYTERDVKVAINNTERTVEDFKALLSPAALPFIEEIAQAAQMDEIIKCGAKGGCIMSGMISL